jgi:predicted outer membrane repeat protein
MKDYERYGYLFYVDQELELVFTITNTIIDNFSNKSVDIDAKLSWNKRLIHPDINDKCETYPDFYKAKGGSIIYLRCSKATMSVNSRKNYYRGADLTNKGGVYYVSAIEIEFGEEGCKFIEEDSIYEGNQAIFGGAIYAENCLNFSFKITNSRFRNNRAVQGGAIMAQSSVIYDTSGIYQ